MSVAGPGPGLPVRWAPVRPTGCQSQEPPAAHLGQAEPSAQVQAQRPSKRAKVLGLCMGPQALCLPCLPALCVTPTPGRRGAQPETSPVGPWEYGRCTRKSRDFHRQLRAEACGRRPLSRGGEDQGPGARASPAPPSGLSGPAGADYGQISEETWAYLHDLYGGGPEVAIRQGVAQLQDPESFHGEQKIEAETRGL